MESKGRIISFRPDTIKNKTKIEIEIDTADDIVLQNIERLMKSDVRFTLKTWREARSRNSNAYFYVLVEKLADALRVSKPFVHNLMLRKYGQIQRIDSRPVWIILPETEEVSKKVDEDESLHLRATDDVKTGKDGKLYRTYLLLKGSHELDSREMNILLDGVIADCHEQNIPTATPEEINRMKAMWGMEVKNGKV